MPSRPGARAPGQGPAGERRGRAGAAGGRRPGRALRRRVRRRDRPAAGPGVSLAPPVRPRAGLLRTGRRRFGPALSGEQFDAVYTLTRGIFWQGDFPAAGTGFADLAGRTTDRRRQAQALYQQARAQELADQWPLATATYRRAFQADPLGNLADAALAGALRISWRRGDEAAANEVYELLIARRQWIPSAARASLYLAASDLVRPWRPCRPLARPRRARRPRHRDRGRLLAGPAGRAGRRARGGGGPVPPGGAA